MLRKVVLLSAIAAIIVFLHFSGNLMSTLQATMTANDYDVQMLSGKLTEVGFPSNPGDVLGGTACLATGGGNVECYTIKSVQGTIDLLRVAIDNPGRSMIIYGRHVRERKYWVWGDNRQTDYAPINGVEFFPKSH
jgi:hypothetical protein